MSIKFYTTGYAKQNIEDLRSLTEKLDAVIADIRFAADSPQMRWRKDYLELLLKHRYRHVPQLGVRQNAGNKVHIQNLEIGLRLIESWDKNVILLCVCAEIENCHRSLIKLQLEKRGHNVAEIINWKLDFEEDT